MMAETGWRKPVSQSLRLRLAISFALIILLSVGLLILTVDFMVINVTENITTVVNRRRAFQFTPVFAEYYQQHKSWQGVEELANKLVRPIPADQSFSLPLSRSNLADILAAADQNRLILVDADDLVRYDTLQSLTPRQLLPTDLTAYAVPVMTGREQVGQLISLSTVEETASIAARRFLRRFLILAGLISSVSAVIVSIFFTYRLTHSLEKLIQAARRFAAGETCDPLPIESNDEIGALTQTFNEMMAALNQQQQLRKQMVADIAHELRTPLSVMQLDLGSLVDGLHDPAEAVVSLRDELDALNRLIEDLRQLSLADAGALRLETAPVVLAPFLQQIAGTWRNKIEAHQLELLTNIAPDLPTIQADEGRLAQVLNNLLSNALRYTPAGKTITLGAEAKSDAVLLWVKDSGPGIDAEDLPYIFERFYRADPSRSRNTGGTGLGLAIAKQWVLLHGGQIWARNEPDGACFFVSLPVTTSSGK